MRRRFTKYPSGYVKASEELDWKSQLTGDVKLDNDIRLAQIKEFVKILKEQPEMENLYPYTWTSGSSTTVYPITIWHRDIELQWGTTKAPRAFMNRMKKIGQQMGVVEDISFSKNDGSCPSVVRIALNPDVWSRS